MTFLLIILASALLTQGIGADAVEVIVEPERVRLGECAQLTVEVAGEGAADCEVSRFPDVPHLFVERCGARMLTEERTLRDPAAAEEIRRAVVVTRYFYRLYALAPGTFALPPIAVSVRGSRIIETAPAVLTVDEPPPGGADAAMTAAVDAERRRFVHEPVLFDVAVRIPAGAVVHGVSLPWIGDRRLVRAGVPDPRGESLRVEMLPLFEARRPESFFVAEAAGDAGVRFVRQDVMLPREPGASEWEPAFAAFRGSDPADPVRYVLCPPLQLQVEPLPAEGRPPGFTNAVGRFDAAIRAEPRRVRVGDSIMARLAVAGRGNNEFIDLPDYPELAGAFRIFSVTEGKSDSSGWPSFERWREFELSPLSTAVAEIPPLAFSFFDPDAARYRTVWTEPVPLEVLPSEGGAAPEAADRRPAADIATIYERVPAGTGWIRTALSAAYWVVGAILAVLLVLAAGSRLSGVRAAARVRRERRALSRFAQGLERLRRLPQGARPVSRLAHLTAAFIGVRCELPASSILAGSVKAQLAARGIGASTAAAAERFFLELDARRFARGAESDADPALCHAAEELARALHAEAPRHEAGAGP